MKEDEFDDENVKLHNSEPKVKRFENKSIVFEIIYTTLENFTLIHLCKQISLVAFLAYFFLTFNYASLISYYHYDEEYFKKDKTDLYLKPEFISKFNAYVRVCLKGKLIDKKKYPLSPNPKISLIMPIYNGGKYLYYSLRSIQNQKIKDIEIILVDDCSTDDSIKIIEKYMAEDPRVRLIKNKENRKILFSKSFAALNSNGKYIMQLDQDDIFIRDDAFKMLYLEAENNNLDLVQIRDFIKPSFYFKKKTIVNSDNGHLIFPQNMHYKQQPDLKDKNFSEKNNFLLWGLLIKSELYKKAIYHLWPIIINYQLIFHEDYTISFMLVILAKKYKYLNNFAIIHLSHDSAASGNHLNEDEYYLGILFFANTLYEYYIKYNIKDIKVLINYIYFFTQGFSLGSTLFPNLHSYIIRKILSINEKYLSNTDKIILRNNFGLNNNNFRIWETYNYIMQYEEYKQISDFVNYPVNKTKHFYKESPAISIIIFCDEFNFLDKTIMSIENQDYNNYEIILIYDNNEENNLNFIKNYINDHKEIKLIKNNQIKGILFSVSKSILSAKGDYILILKSGIVLAKNNILKYLNNEINKSDIDLFEFTHLINNDYIISNNSLNLYRCSHIKSKINLDSIKFNKKYKEIDQNKELLFNKLFRAKFLKDAISQYKIEKYNNIVYNYYDNIILFVVNKKRPKFKYINIFGTIQYESDFRELNIDKISNDEKQKIEDCIFYIDFLYKSSDNNIKDKNFVLYEFYNILNIIYNRYNKISEKAKSLYQTFIDSSYISQKEKEKLEYYYNSLIN